VKSEVPDSRLIRPRLCLKVRNVGSSLTPCFSPLTPNKEELTEPF
jgi:hypothetical protein